VPKFTFTYFNAILLAWYDEIYSLEFDKLLSLILDPNESQSPISNNESLRTAELKLISFEKYNQQIDKIKHHLNRGDSYELNYCIPLLLQTKISPVSIQRKLKDNSPAPFSAFYKHQNNWLISASPERFIKKNGDKLISQPIKGTARRNGNLLEDEKVKKELLTSEKERAENIMITDLVRNDLSKVATRNSVHVDELCGLYSFAQVFQLITTISCQLRPQVDFIQIINALFPMGSMTGAPKFRSMEIIDDLENFQRGLFSGSVGYISPEGDFDFNVVIRSILYNKATQYCSVQVGGAIVYDSDPEQEYEECMTKVKAMIQALAGQIRQDVINCT
jgi:para-aminobenzoate synthetase component 1